MPRNNPTKATLRNKVRSRYKPAQPPLFVRKIQKQIEQRKRREKDRQPSGARPARAPKAPRKKGS